MSVDKTINVLKQLGGNAKEYVNEDGEWEFTVITLGDNNETVNKNTANKTDSES